MKDKKILVGTFHEVGDTYRWFEQIYKITKITECRYGGQFLHLEKIYR